MGSRTPLFDTHVASGAKIVDFGGWDMPLNYGSQIEEHHAVRRDAGMFDVSHMCPVDVKGADARAFLRYLVANNVDRLTQPGKALYSCMLNHAGGVVDDLIIYFLRDDWFRVVVNASTADKDIAWMRKVRMDRAFAITKAQRRDLAMIAVQGPNARAKSSWNTRRHDDATVNMQRDVDPGGICFVFFREGLAGSTRPNSFSRVVASSRRRARARC